MKSIDQLFNEAMDLANRQISANLGEYISKEQNSELTSLYLKMRQAIAEYHKQATKTLSASAG